MRIISGCLKTTPIKQLPVMSNIAPPNIKRENSSQKWINKIKNCEKETSLNTVFKNTLSSKLKSRVAFYL